MLLLNMSNHNNCMQIELFVLAKAGSDSINVMWSPPKDTNILVRYYSISWGKGAPGGNAERVDGKQRYFVIKNLGICFYFKYVIKKQQTADWYF